MSSRRSAAGSGRGAKLRSERAEPSAEGARMARRPRFKRGRETPLRYDDLQDGELLRRYHESGDIRARQELIERHIAFVRRLAQRYARRGEQLDDLTQVGCVGLIKAIDRFDGSFGAS